MYSNNHYAMEFITSTQIPIQVGFKHCIYQHEVYSNNYYTTESITSTQVPIQVGFKHCIYQHEVYGNNHSHNGIHYQYSSIHTSGIQALYLPP